MTTPAVDRFNERRRAWIAAHQGASTIQRRRAVRAGVATGTVRTWAAANRVRRLDPGQRRGQRSRLDGQARHADVGLFCRTCRSRAGRPVRDVLWVENDGSTRTVGELLFCHPNTVRSRLHRIERCSGRSLSKPKNLAELRLALEVHRRLM
jgi:hypothetical protein